MAVVQITLVKGRTREQKAAIAAAINKAMVEIAHSPADHINIVFHEVDRENWAIAGKLLPEYIADMDRK
ncbi:tautomerase family protein [Neorhizobium galegae]|uniref:tautomerase family protein n=1 Tax=Neorhizobium galegae TaxID=399 RepID=UPI001274AF8D|nr:tautomerase family protein [Neorhizobium galegae]KAA9384076.1 4-oxalocrotonate tautomerase [Neorhizobium galegae]KAB1110140.1 4-oxalocrotonate tautomerase [Neorhizobium galegae]MCM2498725.1 tautomerase family protein [Neorhizobium galegae]